MNIMKIGRAYLLKKSVQQPMTQLKAIIITLRMITIVGVPNVCLNPGLLKPIYPMMVVTRSWIETKV